jgi:hypothetical protein
MTGRPRTDLAVIDRMECCVRLREDVWIIRFCHTVDSGRFDESSMARLRVDKVSRRVDSENCG